MLVSISIKINSTILSKYQGKILYAFIEEYTSVLLSAGTPQV